MRIFLFLLVLVSNPSFAIGFVGPNAAKTVTLTEALQGEPEQVVTLKGRMQDKAESGNFRFTDSVVTVDVNIEPENMPKFDMLAATSVTITGQIIQLDGKPLLKVFRVQAEEAIPAQPRESEK